MSIVEGRAYTLRYAASEQAVKAPGGLYVSWSGKGEIVRTGVRRPGLVERQSWWFVKANESGSWYILGETPGPEEPTFGQSPAKLGMSYGGVRNGEPIVLSSPSPFMIKSAGHDVYTLAPAPSSNAESIVADIAIGISGEGEGAEVQIIGGEVKLPKWVIEPLA
ncbi:hypothetical protein RhiJN_23064 [Ceratobasidium sp. AG-Ba]|nr:hypothetical protein RhiJN_23064 [Ceratobasidium sp. AG-Ba]